MNNDISNVDLDDMFKKFSEYADMDISENEFKNLFENFANPLDVKRKYF